MANLLFAVAGYLATQGSQKKKAPKPPAAPRLDDSWHIAIDANSLYAQWIAPGLQTVGTLGAMITRASATASNTAIPGQTWAQMTANAADVDGSYRAGKKNILITGETTNSIYNGARGVAGALADAREYLAARRASRPWDYIIYCGTIPRADAQSDAENIRLNAQLLEVDAAVKADPSMWDIFVDYRAYAPAWFELRSDGMTASFMDSLLTCNSYDKKTPDMVHPIGKPREVMADAVADGIQRLLAKVAK